ncbi:rhodanese-like domain-containing protein [Desulfuromonas carbonis]|uniref:rhodanese-like domain-containing protein n=1 Tax=Desulfuromonas sp. DDH964 TaxID=1823759 RepID=UPI00078DAA93|nr:rhodanese-like domain-containing protein [Desulfuromonas sp. DDH964]AMV73312.1 rhodanese-like domain-containing protein [Desulfuromonas sp. DDH964]
MYERLNRDLLESLVIFAVGVLIGLSVNYRLILDAFAGRLQAAPTAVEAVVRYPAPVDLAGVQEALRDGALAIDARIPELFAAGHISGARSLPLADIDQALPAFQVAVPVTTRLVVYCSGYGCPDSYDLAVRLLEAGYRNVLVFEGGFPAWQDAGLPVTTGGAP